ncbi:tumor necrosis factor receptor superfamily member 6 [Poecilia latipinna]|uniref:tumor necrosis factor receptor superfamily member 6 n=1 Tax=Poecilia latipinna TaxID=48699 RepID=UPI00072DD498|nr:PREDICTED: tumor necrosis factor receptor superfamily member 6-like [Poecilia latipinna]
MMVHLYYLAFSLLWSLPVFSSGLVIQCKDGEYEWPILEPTLCCKKCPPGHRYISRSDKTCEITCEPCDENRYSDNFNLERNCNVCDVCKKANFEVASNCTTTKNTVCKCRAGYRCKDKSCTFCEPVPTTTQPTTPPSTTVAGSTSTTKITVPPNNKIRDTQWFLVIIALLCAGIALVVMTKIKPILHWIRSNHGYFLPEKTVTATLCAVEDDVSKPVQEVCGKCDHCIDLCIKD